MAIPSELPLLSQKSLPDTTESDLAAYCNVHDLLATVHVATQDVIVYRITNGQTAFTIKRPSEDDEVAAVKWKADGSLIGVAWTRGLCGVYDGEGGRLIGSTSVLGGKVGVGDWGLDLNIVVDDEGKGEGEEREYAIPSCLGWTAHVVSSAAGVSKVREESSTTTEEWFEGMEHDAQDPDFQKQKSGIAELTASITTLDATKVLPRLSAIPAHGVRGGSTVFTSQTSTDSIFDASKARSGIVDTLITSTTSGYTQVLLDDSLNIGSFDLQYRATKHASHPQCNSQVVLSETAEENSDPAFARFRLHYIDLSLEILGGPFLHTIAANTKRMQNLMEYVKQTVRCVQHDFETGLQFPSRLINSIKQELLEKEEGDLVTNLYELAMGGRFTPTMLEWLTDIVKETNHKRWDQAVNTMYTNIQNHLFINLLPALDRMSMAASALRGQARFHEGTTKFEVEPEAFATILDAVDSIRLIAQKMELVIMTEHRQFRAFSKWMRVMIEIGVAGPGSRGAAETEERETPNLDYSLLLEYIKTTMSRSGLVLHVEQLPDMRGSRSKEDFFAHPVVAQMKRKYTIEALEKLDNNEGNHESTSLLNLPTLTAVLAAKARLAIDAITTWQRKMIPNPTPCPLITPLRIEEFAQILDLRLFPINNIPEFESITDILTTSEIGTPSNELHLYRITRLAEQKSKFQFAQADFVLQSGGSVVDGTMLDERRAMVLFQYSEGSYALLDCDLQAYGTESGGWTRTLKRIEGWVPERILVGGREGKKVCVVFGEGCREWRVYDLDGNGDADGGALEGGDDEMEVE